MARRATKKKDLSPEEKLAQALVPVGEWPYEVPGNWCWVRLGSVLFLQAGKNISAKMVNSEPTEHSSYPCFGGNGIRGYVSIFNREGSFPIIGRQGALCGNINWASGKFYATEHAVVVDCMQGVEKRWAYYILDDMKLNQYATATAQPGLAVSNIVKLPLALPPLPEQQRIVARIESLFAKLDEAKEKAQAVVDGFEERKAAILHQAFTGELTKGWREEKRITRDSWMTVILKEIVTGFKYGTSEKSDYSYNGIPVLRIPNIVDNGIDFTDIKYLQYTDIVQENQIHENDILIIRSNGSRDLVGKCALVPHLDREYTYASFLIRIKPSKRVRADYLVLFLNSSDARTQMFAKAKSSAGINNINSKELGDISLYLPALDEQAKIVCILRNLLDKQQQAKSAALQTIDQIDTMKKAIRARAFRGELGTNDPTEESAVEMVKGMSS